MIRAGSSTRPLLVLALLLAGSGVFRLGEGAGAAMALNANQPVEDTAAVPAPTKEDVAAALAAIRAREDELARREDALAQRTRALSLAEDAVRDQLAELTDAEVRLRELLSLSDEMAEQDLAQLTAVYENMKPKEASALFERMSPDFAAGFLGRMRPDAAAAIMSGLPPDFAYSVSVLLAGRNADAAAAVDGL